MNFVNTYGLEKYDWNNKQKEQCPYKRTSSLMKRGSKGESVAWLQWMLNHNGANLKIDKIYGPLTELAVVLYQKKYGLVVDGKAGPVVITFLMKTTKY